LWVDITPVGGTDYHLADADFSPDWQTMMPFSNGLRLSFPGGRISDDLGYTWQGPALLDYGVATHPLDPDLMVGSNHIGTAVSNTGPYGPFINKANIGFTRIHVRQIAESKGVYYAATDAGLAWTKEYFNPAITGYDQWIPPNGLFPIPNVGDETGVSAVTVDPNDSLHVICGFREGFFVSFTGPTGFFQVIPQDWNMIHLDPFVTDILFVNPNLVIAITGYKFREVRVPPPQPVGNIWRSTDGGLSWYMVTPFFPDEFTMGNTLALGFDGFQVQLYAGSGHQGGIIPPTPGALWKSTNMGNTWFKVNDGPFSVGGIIQPVFDLDVIPGSTEKLFLAADEVVARSNDGGISYMISGVPGNVGSYYSVLIDPVYPDSVNLGAGRNLLKYNYLIDEADLKFRGLPGEPLHELALGSTLAGTSTGGHKIEEAKRYYLDLTLFIEGPFNGITMDTTLNAAGYLPLSQPFNTSPWNYNGTESVTAIPNSDVVDWVLVELREAGSAPAAGSITRFDRQACFLLRNGKISGKDGASSPRFNLVVTEDIYGVIYSPNHIPVMSANALSLLTETFAYNFSTGATQVYGGSNGHKQLAAGVWGMFSGDGDADGQVTMGDKVDVWAVQSGSSGYLSGDFNRDSQVNNTDKIYYWGPNAGVGSQVVP
ncbi:MAG: hypothetical protein JW861_12460, partial [Bacteroidales bacterium]|nr:hypothetical protein [Bacteroidales bacterium]